MKLFLVKLSGKVIDSSLLTQLLQEIDIFCKSNNYKYIIIHGGGNTLSEYSKSIAIQPTFDIEGHRITSHIEMIAAQRILAGQIRCNLVAECKKAGIPAVGLSASDGNMLEATYLYKNDKTNTNFTGYISSCDTTILSTLLHANFVPVVNSVACNKDGILLNVNADELAVAIALSYSPHILLFLSDTTGIMQDNTTVIKKINSKTGEALIRSETIHSGMRKKVTMAIQLAKQNSTQIFISNYTQKDDITRIIEYKKGTYIYDS